MKLVKFKEMEDRDILINPAYVCSIRGQYDLFVDEVGEAEWINTGTYIVLVDGIFLVQELMKEVCEKLGVDYE